MNSLILFCKPDNTYRGLSENQTAKEYTHMAIDEYDKLIKFAKKYELFLITPDFEELIGKKEGKNIWLTLFAQQAMIQVGKLNQEFTSSSYLFNPENDNKELLLPDLDVIQMKGSYQVREATEIIRRFYESFGWQTYIFDGAIQETKLIRPQSEIIVEGETIKRFQNKINIINPEELKQIAKEKINYNLEKLCF